MHEDDQIPFHTLTLPTNRNHASKKNLKWPRHVHFHSLAFNHEKHSLKQLFIIFPHSPENISKKKIKIWLIITDLSLDDFFKPSYSSSMFCKLLCKKNYACWKLNTNLVTLFLWKWWHSVYIQIPLRLAPPQHSEPFISWHFLMPICARD